MCYPLILGSVEPLPVSQYAPQEDEEDWHIFVRACGKAQSRDEQAIFSTRQLYHIYARQTGDACGFRGNDEEAQSAREELAVFLECSLKLVADLQLYVACTDFDDSGVIPTNFENIGPRDIRTWNTGFIEGDFFQVIHEEWLQNRKH
ncbi:hypothetical protein [Gimesia algae]|uniref:Uncharacterized protein n=1 Tax=Gimesia algae TaxID=2527971 RepID=A0A517VIJ6_9PLAN|nr:hypothetical protein [Gimesia algae]QDT92824.1 hypothetical protein Pan161_44950 [Gimesia algae]